MFKERVCGNIYSTSIKHVEAEQIESSDENAKHLVF